MAKSRSTRHRRCLIVERHSWETGGAQQQLQFVLRDAARFFGPGRRDRQITLRIFLNPRIRQPSFVKDIVISREYANGTRRTNRFAEMGAIPSSFVFFEETHLPDTYDFWWIEDKAAIAAPYTGWKRGRDTQHGRGRLSIIVDAPAPRHP